MTLTQDSQSLLPDHKGTYISAACISCISLRVRAVETAIVIPDFSDSFPVLVTLRCNRTSLRERRHLGETTQQ